MHRHYLPTPLRRTLEKTIKQARIVAEEGAGDAIRRLGVAEAKPPAYLGETERNLRRRLRAHARALGDSFDRDTETLATRKLVEATAYAHWHRMLFARFLAERALLHHPEHGVAVTLEDCRELAAEEGLPDAWAAAERYAALMLPGVFRIDDPVLELDLDPAHNQSLIRLVTDLDSDVFQAEDSLGWTYQFWRAAEKDAVNKSGVKIGADELPAVTQLFTEPYMVRFLLHNTLGAWWAGKVLAADPALAKSAADEDALRAACSLPDYTFDMLRFVREGEDGPWRPAAGTFPGWPKEAKAVTVLDPCCGSGHFLTEALAILAALRQAEEQLSPPEAVAAVLRDNLHGLEIDGRCVQIAAFAVALTAWRIGGWQTLPLPHIAWVGAPPPLLKSEFVTLANGDTELKYALAALHDLFAQAPVLGSLIEPSGGDLFEAEKLREIARLFEPILVKARSAEPAFIEGIVSARGMSDAAEILNKKYVLQATNVPFLGRNKQTALLASFILSRFNEAKSDLATAMLMRMRNMSKVDGSFAIVSPQHWWYQGSYKALRHEILEKWGLRILGAIGANGFQTPMYHFNTAICIFDRAKSKENRFSGLDLSDSPDPEAKAKNLKKCEIVTQSQKSQLLNPDARISLETIDHATSPLKAFAECYQGIRTGDRDRFACSYWEVEGFSRWRFLRTTVKEHGIYNGCSDVVRWENGAGQLHAYAAETRDRLHDMHESGNRAWGRRGIAINTMGSLRASPYEGEIFDGPVSVIVPINAEHYRAVYAYCHSNEYRESVKKIEKNLNITNATLLKVPFDLMHWETTASVLYEDNIPDPSSFDPTQWLFHGHPVASQYGTALHVALARACGYRWPAESSPDMRLSQEARSWIEKASALPLGDNDGLLA